MKFTRKIVSVVLAALMTTAAASAAFTANASTGELCDYYSTNPDNKVGVAKTITIDGDASDWSEDMLIAQGAAWDVANHYKGGHENCVLDTYALYAAWDDDNLYIGWQMVNTTDTWANEGDGPLSDGGRVLDVPLILALSVDESSTSMSNKNTSGGSIWGQQMGVTFETHVDRLLYMSGKVGLGEPGLFTAVDDEGNTDYDEGYTSFSTGGIEYAMAETNISSLIMGLNYSESTSDIYDSSADWVDYKTYEGTMGTHDTSYDSFYEISIPLETLGITRSYLESNGVGAMLIATRGESGLDCIPYDDTMLDNATEDYSSDSSTSHEKDDEDVITSDFARIGSLGSDVQPTTAQSTTAAATTVPSTTTADTEVTVTAQSNLFPEESITVSEDADEVTVTYSLTSAMNLVNGLWTLTYDSSVLSIDSSKNADIMPNISEVSYDSGGSLSGTFSEIDSPYDFTSSREFVKVTYDVVGTGSTTINMDVKTLSVGSGSSYKNAVKNSEIVDLSGVSGFTSSELTALTELSDNSGITYGDVNGDGSVDVDDATLIQKYIAELSLLSGTYLAAADTDHDGLVTILDATLIQKYAAGVVTSLD